MNRLSPVLLISNVAFICSLSENGQRRLESDGGTGSVKFD
jgi:hypothetical protein